MEGDGSAEVAERLRAFVREHVRDGGEFYQWGNGARLAEFLGVGSEWVSRYTDPKPEAHADIDRALAICEFYGVTLESFVRTSQPQPTKKPDPARSEALKLAREILHLDDDQRSYLRRLVRIYRRAPRATNEDPPDEPPATPEASQGTTGGRRRRER